MVDSCNDCTNIQSFAVPRSAHEFIAGTATCNASFAVTASTCGCNIGQAVLIVSTSAPMRVTCFGLGRTRVTATGHARVENANFCKPLSAEPDKGDTISNALACFAWPVPIKHFSEKTTVPNMNIACHCGQVRIKLTGEPVVDLYCHCRDCQRIAGGGYVPYSIYPHAGVEVIEGKTLKWALKDNQRTRCANCGTYLFGDPVGMGVHGISAYLLPPGVFKPQLHIMCKDALIPVKDDLPHFTGFPASLGGSDDTVDW